MCRKTNRKSQKLSLVKKGKLPLSCSLNLYNQMLFCNFIIYLSHTVKHHRQRVHFNLKVLTNEPSQLTHNIETTSIQHHRYKGYFSTRKYWLLSHPSGHWNNVDSTSQIQRVLFNQKILATEPSQWTHNVETTLIQHHRYKGHFFNQKILAVEPSQWTLNVETTSIHRWFNRHCFNVVCLLGCCEKKALWTFRRINLSVCIPIA